MTSPKLLHRLKLIIKNLANRDKVPRVMYKTGGLTKAIISVVTKIKLK